MLFNTCPAEKFTTAGGPPVPYFLTEEDVRMLVEEMMKPPPPPKPRPTTLMGTPLPTLKQVLLSSTADHGLAVSKDVPMPDRFSKPDTPADYIRAYAAHRLLLLRRTK